METTDITTALPHDILTEQMLLGAILNDNEEFNQVEEIVKSEHFFEPVHGRIFSAISML
jgi:replicative DNA helicase